MVTFPKSLNIWAANYLNMNDLHPTATFADLTNPKVANYTSEGITKDLESIASGGFEYFSPKTLGLHFLANMARSTGDSHYGCNLDLTQKIMASALYSGSDLVQYFQKVSSNNKEQAEAEKIKCDSKLYQFTKYLKLIPERLRRRFGFEKNYGDSYLNGNQLEEESIAKKNVLTEVYARLALTIDSLVHEFGKQDTSSILELVELNHFFSGEKNKTGRDITFTHPRLKHYGAEIQELVDKVWYNGTNF